MIADELEMEDGLDAYWETASGTSNRKCERYLKRSLLKKLDAPLVLCLDNVDQIFQYQEISADFFGLLRSWHEGARTDEIWAKLRMVISYTKEVYVSLNINQSPFNVGVQIELPAFNLAQMTDLVRRHGLFWLESEVLQLMQLLGGQPHLVRVALYRIVRQEMTLKELLSSAPTEGGLYGEYLKDLLLILREKPALVEAMQQIVASPTPIRVETAIGFQLASLGVVRRIDDQVQVFCELYRQYFSDRLGMKP